MADPKSEEYRKAFEEEARELLSELETALLELESRPSDPELIARVFRAMHTIKGSGAMFGYREIAQFTHEVETAFDQVRSGRVSVTQELIDLTLQARDHIRFLLDNDTSMASRIAPESIVDALRKLVGHSETPARRNEKSCAATTPPEEDQESTFRIFFRPPMDIATRGIDPSRLLEELQLLGHCTTTPRTRAIPTLDDLNPEACYLAWDVILSTTRGINAIKDVFLFVQDDSELKIEQIEPPIRAGAETKKLGDILIERGDATPELVQKGLSNQKRFGEVLVDLGAVDQEKVTLALAEQKHLKTLNERRQAAEAQASVRVPSEKLDKLMDLVGELVTIQSLLSQVAQELGKTRIPAIAESVERLTAELRDTTMGIRMLPIGTTFTKFNRLVRDLSHELGKEIQLVTEGAETELDKTVIEKLNDPLVHILRNCIDHGIEPPAVRALESKAPMGTVRLSARQSGAQVLIQVEDDGKGLDSERIRAKAIEKGMISAEANLSEKDLYSLIFAPGFSTAAAVTSVSGRGVGMDVVKRAIDTLGGSIDIRSRKGSGTTITLQIPLTLAIIEGLLVKVGDESLIMPLSVVEECVELTRRAGEHARRDLANVRGQLVPYIRLRDHLRIDGAPLEIEQIVITQLDGKRVGFVVDRVLGSHQTVIKNLGTMFKTVEGLSGGTILGDGTVALILDPAKLRQNAELSEIRA